MLLIIVAICPTSVFIPVSTTTNIIDGNTLFGDNNGIIANTTTTNEVQGTTVDPNSYFTNTNFDTNAIYGQTQILPETTTTTTTTTTNENTYFTQPQEIQGTNQFIKYLIIENAGHQGIYITGSKNTIDHVITRYNNDSGIQLSDGASDNTINYCWSYSFNICW